MRSETVHPARSAAARAARCGSGSPDRHARARTRSISATRSARSTVGANQRRRRERRAAASRASRRPLRTSATTSAISRTDARDSRSARRDVASARAHRDLDQLRDRRRVPSRRSPPLAAVVPPRERARERVDHVVHVHEVRRGAASASSIVPTRIPRRWPARGTRGAAPRTVRVEDAQDRDRHAADCGEPRSHALRRDLARGVRVVRREPVASRRSGARRAITSYDPAWTKRAPVRRASSSRLRATRTLSRTKAYGSSCDAGTKVRPAALTITSKVRGEACLVARREIHTRGPALAPTTDTPSRVKRDTMPLR